MPDDTQQNGGGGLGKLPIPKRGDPSLSTQPEHEKVVRRMNALLGLKIVPSTAGKVIPSESGFTIEITNAPSTGTTGTTTTLIGAKYDPSTGNATGIQFDAVITNISTYSG